MYSRDDFIHQCRPFGGPDSNCCRNDHNNGNGRAPRSGNEAHTMEQMRRHRNSDRCRDANAPRRSTEPQQRQRRALPRLQPTSQISASLLFRSMISLYTLKASTPDTSCLRFLKHAVVHCPNHAGPSINQRGPGGRVPCLREGSSPEGIWDLTHRARQIVVRRTGRAHEDHQKTQVAFFKIAFSAAGANRA
jgi:hypothetical protein